jgi:hypothetical protein
MGDYLDPVVNRKGGDQIKLNKKLRPIEFSVFVRYN